MEEQRQELQGMPWVGGAVCSGAQGRCCCSQLKMHFPLAGKWHSRKNLKGNGAGAKWKFETLGALSRKSLDGLASSSELMLGFSLSRDCGRGVSQCVSSCSRRECRQLCMQAELRLVGVMELSSTVVCSPSSCLLHCPCLLHRFKYVWVENQLSLLSPLSSPIGPILSAHLKTAVTHSIFGLRDWSQG